MSVLVVDPSAPWIVKAAAETVLLLHIGGGAVGMVSGAAALVVRKGSRLHAAMGKLFVVSMLTMATIGASVSPFLDPLSKAAPNIIAGIVTFYLVLSSWMTVRRKDGRFGPIEIGGFAAALTVCAAGLFFIIEAMASPTGTIGDTPPETFYVFLLVGAIAAASDFKVMLKGGVLGIPRLARHLWRMCVALTIASGSFFLGQAQVLPKFVQGSSLLFVPVFAPLVLMVFWLIRIRFRSQLMAGGPRAVDGVKTKSGPETISNVALAPSLGSY